MWPVARSVLMRQGALTAAAQRDAGVAASRGRRPWASCTRMMSASSGPPLELRAQRPALARLIVHERKQVADRVDLRALRGILDTARASATRPACQ